MDAGDEQNAGSGSTNGNAQTGASSRPPQIAHMSLYERQAVQALQALQRQPNAAQYFQQLMLQQQINSAQLHNLAAVQQATLAASRQSSSPSNSGSQATTTVNLSTTSAGGVTNPRPLGPATSATSSALSQSVLLGGSSAGQGQMYLRVNRSLRAPIASQLIFMPGGTATAAVATVTQQQPQQQQQQQQQAQQAEAPPTSSSVQSDSDQVQNLALHCVSTPRLAAVKSEFPDRKDAVNYSQQQQPQTQQHQFSTLNSVPSHQFSQGSAQTQVQPLQQQQMASKMAGYTHSTTNVKGGTQATMVPACPLPPSTSSSTLPLSQLLLSPSGLCQARAVTTVNPAATVTHILVPTSNVATSTQGYPITSVTTKTGNTQTLVVQPLQQASVDKGPVPIQPKTAQSHRVPVQLPPRHPPPILPAPPSSQASAVGHHSPHIPVQLVGARPGSAGNTQVVALALAQARSACAQDSTAAVTATNTITMSKLPVGSLKRKSESDATNDMAVEPSLQDCPPMTDSAPPLSPAPTQDSAPEPVAAFSSPPTLSLSLPLSRGLGGQADRPPLPQAVVKPQVLTHLIEGFVIQEGAEPFPVAGLVKERAEGPFSLAGAQIGDSGGPAVMKCEYCESFAPASQFRGSKRFCSKTCAKRYNVSCSHHFRTSRGRVSAGPPGPPTPSEPVVRRRGPRRSSSEIACAKIAGRHLPVKCRSVSSRSEDVSSCDAEEEEEEEDSPSLSPSSSLSCPRPAHCGPQSESTAPGGLPLDGENFLPGSPAHWNVEEVCRFISSLQGCEDLAAQFLSQEIDGQALLLLREEHLISTMNIKLGPALKICASIHNLRD